MRRQLDMLRASDWNALIILDACRGDVLQELVPEVEVVRGFAPHTAPWFRGMMQRDSLPDGTVYLTRNPMPASIYDPPEPDWPQLTMRSLWGENGRAGPPTELNEVVWRLLKYDGQPEHLVAHYHYPHHPYVRGSWMAEDPCYPPHAYARGVPLAEIRRAYRANIEIVLPAVLGLLSVLRGTVVITADHGEMLGEQTLPDEQPAFVHDVAWDFDELFRVPWLEYDLGEFEPAPPPPPPTVTDEDRTRNLLRLEDLGYA